VQLHIGIDDTDSAKGGCTTYIAARLVETITKMGTQFIDYPNIIRLNPNIPYKTRGNAAVALRLETPKETYNKIQEAVLREIEKDSRFGQADTDPGVVFYKGQPTERIKQFSRRALWDILRDEDAIRILRTSKSSAAAYGSRLGLVGALSAVGQTLHADHTFELIAYRTKENCGKPRKVDEESVKRMDRLTTPRTFNNYDYENSRTLITPHGPDPVLLGIRGETPQTVRNAFMIVKVREPVERWVIFRTNHGTDAHFQNTRLRNQIELDKPVVLRGIVDNQPWRIAGGHVFFTIRRGKLLVDCAAYEPTGIFREQVAGLSSGDDVTVYGAAKKNPASQNPTINLEKIQIHRLVDVFEIENPSCPNCGKRMKSAGRGQGFRCERCSIASSGLEKRRINKPRLVLPGIYLPALKAHRHLTKPLSRCGLEKEKWDRKAPSGRWHYP
jgi:tRNA(Ile2)-agmatinylcytidine synthase